MGKCMRWGSIRPLPVCDRGRRWALTVDGRIPDLGIEAEVLPYFLFGRAELAGSRDDDADVIHLPFARLRAWARRRGPA